MQWCHGDVVVGVPLGDARPHRQHRPGAFQSLDLRFLIDADHDRVLWRCQVQARDVADFRFELRAGGELEPLGAVLGQAEPAPQHCDRIMADADLPGLAQPVRAAPARPVRHPLGSQGFRRRGHRGSQDAGIPPPRSVQSSGRPAAARLPARPARARRLAAPLDDRRLGAARPLRDLRVGQPANSQQHDCPAFPRKYKGKHTSDH